MFKIQHPIVLDAEKVLAPNLVEFFGEEDLKAIGVAVHQGFVQDRASRAKWEQRTEAAMDLAMQMTKDKNFPWPGASNVAFPLVTIAVMQFHAKAYPALVSGTNLVKMRVVGDDPEGKEAERARRVGLHMSYQALEEDSGWEENHDTLLINYSIVGSGFKKVRPDARRGSAPTSDFVAARDLVLDYWTRDFATCPRMTHIIPLFRNEIWEKVRRGVFADVLEEAWFTNPPQPRTTEGSARRDSRTGQNPSPVDFTTPFIILEQHVDLDLDGDGYAEPYIITIEETSQRVLQIACRFDRFDEDIERNNEGEIITIHARRYFERYIFLPSPDGGIYGVGFGVLLGPLNESVNTIVNQLIDSGTMQVTAGGFLGRGAKIRGGAYTFAPFEWKRVDSTGDDLRKNIVPLEVREPSAVLFQLLGLLIQYADRIPGTTEANVGENIGQNTPAETARNMLIQGQKVYAAIFKRAWRGMKGEFKLWYGLNALYMPDTPQKFGEGGVTVRRLDYLGPNNVVPAADPNITSDELALAQAQAVLEAAYQRPGYNYVEAERGWLAAMKVANAEALYPGLGAEILQTLPPLGGEDPKVTAQKMKNELELQLAQMEFQLDVAELQGQLQVMQAETAKLKAEAMKALSGIEGEAQQRQIEQLNTVFDAMNMREQNMINRIGKLLEAKKLQIEERKLTQEKKSGGSK